MTDQTAAPRPVPTFADRTATNAPLPTWLPDALDELRATRAELERLRTALDRTNTDRQRLQSEIDVTDTAVVDTVRRLHRTEVDRDEALDARDVLRHRLDAMKAAKKRVLGSLEKAEHVIDLIRDGQEQIDRALATYDTTPGEATEREDEATPERVAEDIAAAIETHFLPDDLTAIQAARIARHHATQYGQAPSSVPSRRAQEEPTRPTAAQLARLFHDTYEQLAPKYGYETREESAKPWEQVPKANRELMVATCARVLVALFGPATDGVVGEPPARAFVGEPPCSNPGCPCGGTA